MRIIKSNRSLLMYILLSILTLGIYHLYFIYSIARDINEMCEGDGDHTAGLIVFTILNFVTCGIYSFIWMYKLGNRLQINADDYKDYFPENGTTILLWLILGNLICGIGSFIALHIIIKNTNQLARHYNNKYSGLNTCIL